VALIKATVSVIELSRSISPLFFHSLQSFPWEFFRAKESTRPLIPNLKLMNRSLERNFHFLTL